MNGIYRICSFSVTHQFHVAISVINIHFNGKQQITHSLISTIICHKILQWGIAIVFNQYKKGKEMFLHLQRCDHQLITRSPLSFRIPVSCCPVYSVTSSSAPSFFLVLPLPTLGEPSPKQVHNPHDPLFLLCTASLSPPTSAESFVTFFFQKASLWSPSSVVSLVISFLHTACHLLSPQSPLSFSSSTESLSLPSPTQPICHLLPPQAAYPFLSPHS